MPEQLTKKRRTEIAKQATRYGYHHDRSKGEVYVRCPLCNDWVRCLVHVWEDPVKALHSVFVEMHLIDTEECSNLKAEIDRQNEKRRRK